MRLSVIIAGLLFATVLYVVDSPSVHAQAQTNNPTVESKIVQVQTGDTLSKIGSAHQTTYQRLYDANLNIKDPDVIYPGDPVRIPRPDETLTSRSGQAPAPTPTVKPQQAPASPKAKTKATPAPAANNVNGGVWDRLAQCESGGNWSINTGNGFYGGLQFTLSSWRAVGGSGYPHQASKSEQIARAEKLRAIQGWGAWPACSSKLGLR